ncbi:MAG: nickel transporter [Xanthobacteraceae bacterium]|jgi:nickel/cobalt exporter
MRLIRGLSLAAAVIVLLVLATSALDSAFAQAGPLGAIRPPPAEGIAGWILAKQALFYRALSGLIRAAKTDGSAYWGLMGISFIYGIFHAAGPGHGKAVIASYLLANEETWRRGIALSFASALLQALTAVVIVAIAAVLIGATAKMMGDTVRVIEMVSYMLIVLLGARLIWVKGRGFLRALHAVRSGPEPAAAETAADHVPHVHAAHANCHRHDHSHHDHADHDHAHGHHHHAADEEEDVLPWGHAHGPEPEELAGPGGWRRGLSAIVAVGLRPCSGAIIVLVFALAQGLFWAGVASTFVMGVGAAITVAAIATLAVAAKAAAKRFAAARNGYGSLILRGVEVGAALAVMAFGVLMLTGTMASERMGMF